MQALGSVAKIGSLKDKERLPIKTQQEGCQIVLTTQWDGKLYIF